MINMAPFALSLAVASSTFGPATARGMTDVRVAGLSGGPIIRANGPVTVQCSPPDRSSRFKVDLCDCGSSCDDDTDCGVFVAELGRDVVCDAKEDEDCSLDFTPPEEAIIEASGHGGRFKVRVTDVHDDTYVSCSPPIEVDLADDDDVYDPCSEFAVRRLGEEFNNDWGDDDGCTEVAGKGFCSNGVPGVDDRGDVCCKLECGDECGGVDCAKRHGDVTADDCCVHHIKAAGLPCSDTQGAPCMMSGGFIRSGTRPGRGGGTVDEVITGGGGRTPGKGKRRHEGRDVHVTSRFEGSKIRAGSPVTVQCSPPDRSSRFKVDLCDCGSSCDDDTDCGVFVAELGRDVVCDAEDDEDCSLDFTPPEEAIVEASGHGRYFKVRVTDVYDDTYVSCSSPIELDDDVVHDPCSEEFAVRRLGEEFNNDWGDDDGCTGVAGDGEEGEKGFCSNGVPGVDDGRHVCCKLECGYKCGGDDCAERGGDRTADDCCVGHIEAAGLPCSDAQGAPCMMNGDYTRPRG